MSVRSKVNSVQSELMFWSKLVVSFLIIAWMVLASLSLFGFVVVGVARLGWQEAGVFIAGMSYALSKL